MSFLQPRHSIWSGMFHPLQYQLLHHLRGNQFFGTSTVNENFTTLLLKLAYSPKNTFSLCWLTYLFLWLEKDPLKHYRLSHSRSFFLFHYIRFFLPSIYNICISLIFLYIFRIVPRHVSCLATSVASNLSASSSSAYGTKSFGSKFSSWWLSIWSWASPFIFRFFGSSPLTDLFVSSYRSSSSFFLALFFGYLLLFLKNYLISIFYSHERVGRRISLFISYLNPFIYLATFSTSSFACPALTSRIILYIPLLS